MIPRRMLAGSSPSIPRTSSLWTTGSMLNYSVERRDVGTPSRSKISQLVLTTKFNRSHKIATTLDSNLGRLAITVIEAGLHFALRSRYLVVNTGYDGRRMSPGGRWPSGHWPWLTSTRVSSPIFCRGLGRASRRTPDSKNPEDEAPRTKHQESKNHLCITDRLIITQHSNNLYYSADIMDAFLSWVTAIYHPS